MTELDARRALEFERSLARRCATRVVPFRWGEALFNPGLPRVWDMNFLNVDPTAGSPSAGELAAEAERLQADHVDHRKIVVRDAAAGARLSPDLESLGWKVERNTLMIRRREPDRPSPGGVAREVTLEEIAPAWELAARRAFEDLETARQILEMNQVLRRACTVRYFATLVDGAPVSHCELYLIGDRAQIESVATLEEHRGRGFARAVVLAAAEAAGAGGCDLVFLRADEDGWPKELYRKLGFDAAGLSYEWLKHPGGAVVDA